MRKLAISKHAKYRRASKPFQFKMKTNKFTTSTHNEITFKVIAQLELPRQLSKVADTRGPIQSSVLQVAP
jgi:hypothetical protein